MADAPTGTRRAIGVIGVGRIGRMHAELLARRVPGAAVTAVYDAHAGQRARGRRRARRDAPRPVDELLAAPDVDAVAICTSHRHPRRPDRRGRRRPARRSSARSPSRSTSPRSTARSPRSTRAGVPFQIGFNRRFDPAHRGGARRRGRRARSASRSSSRISSRDPAPPPIEYVARLGRHLPRHDHPRLRHGALRHRQRGRRGLRARRAYASTPALRATSATSTPRWSRSRTRTAA